MFILNLTRPQRALFSMSVTGILYDTITMAKHVISLPLQSQNAFIKLLALFLVSKCSNLWIRTTHVSKKSLEFRWQKKNQKCLLGHSEDVKTSFWNIALLIPILDPKIFLNAVNPTAEARFACVRRRYAKRASKNDSARMITEKFLRA